MNVNENFWYHNYQVVQAQLLEYYERNQKAIEYIEQFDGGMTGYIYCKEVDRYKTEEDAKEHLLDILKGNNNE